MTARPESPAQPGRTSSIQLDPGELADLDALADELSKLGFPATRLTPPGRLPYVDTGLPQGMVPGERIHVQAGTFFWRVAEPIAPSDQPAIAAAIIARVIQPNAPANGQHRSTP